MEQKINKVHASNIEQLDQGSRTVLAVISSSAIDRDNEVVLPKAMRKKQYAGNSVVMVNHDYTSLPIGKALWVKADGDKVLAKYHVTDKTELGRDVFALLQDGILNAHSIGFTSYESSAPTTKEIKANPEWAAVKRVHRDFELLEFSVVGIPANPAALTIAVSKGISKATLDLLKAPMEAKAVEDLSATVVEAKALERLSDDETIRRIMREAEKLSANLDVDGIIQRALKRII